jgi:hypothetical protein
MFHKKNKIEVVVLLPFQNISKNREYVVTIGNRNNIITIAERTNKDGS